MGNECCSEKDEVSGRQQIPSVHTKQGPGRKIKDTTVPFAPAAESEVNGTTGISRTAHANTKQQIQLAVRMNDEKHQIISDKLLARKFKF